MKEIINESLSIQTLVNATNFFKSFENAKPSIKKESQLGVCKFYVGQKTCCDLNLANIIDYSSLVQLQPIQQAQDAFQKLLSSYIYLLYEKCKRQNIVPASVDKIVSNKNLTTFYNLWQNHKKCKISFGQAIASFNRGIMCSICSGIDKLQDYFQFNKIKISPDSANAFEREINESIKCISDLFTQENLNKILNELNSFYIKNNDFCPNQINDIIKKTYSDPKISLNDQQGNQKCNGTQILSDQILCKKAIQGSADLSDKVARFLPENQELQKAIELKQKVFTGVGGLIVYLKSESNKNINENNINIALINNQIINNVYPKIRYQAEIELFSKQPNPKKKMNQIKNQIMLLEIKNLIPKAIIQYYPIQLYKIGQIHPKFNISKTTKIIFEQSILFQQMGEVIEKTIINLSIINVITNANGQDISFAQQHLTAKSIFKQSKVQKGNASKENHLDYIYSGLSEVKLIFNILVQTSLADSFSCANHPLYSQIKQLIQESVKGDEALNLQASTFFDQYENGSPTNLQANQLGACSVYTGQKTCCNLQISRFIDTLAVKKVDHVQKSKDAFQKLVQSYANLISSQCSKQNIISTTPEQIFANKQLKNFQILRTAKKQCKVKFGKALSAFNRGVFCSICSGSDKINDYYKNNKLILSIDSVNAFERDSNNAIDCLSKIFTSDNLDNLLKEFNSYYIKNNDSCINQINTKIKSTFLNPQVKSQDENGNKKCKGTNLFTTNIQCEQALQGQVEVLNAPNNRILNEDENSQRNLLQNSDVTTGVGGILIYIPSETDKNIQEDVVQAPNFTFQSKSTDSSILDLTIYLLTLILLN
ncbi:hypothetical protein ABPG74_008789 [Tetrahymena malaccensis]